MIDPKRPDFANTPASDRRPLSWYAAADEGRAPLFTVVTPYFNTGAVFWDTFRCLRNQSIPYWEWLIIDDGSTDAASLEQLRSAQEQEPRIRVIRQANAGPSVARNRAAREARGTYLLILDSDDMVEPTFVEKAIWFLETQPAEFAAVNAYNVSFGSKDMLWPYGFARGSENINENYNTIQSVVRTADYLAVGGFDESISYEHADWDFWLTLADSGRWGYTIPEYLTWYRTQERSLLTEIETDRKRAVRFRSWLRNKHRGLSRRFPNPQPLRTGRIPDANYYAKDNAEASLVNPLAKPPSARRVLVVAPWMEVGGAEQLNLDMLRELTRNGYQCTLVTTLRSDNPWMSRFTDITPDVFALQNFLTLADHPRFLSYLIESRQIDAIVVSNSEFGYAALPYLRARHPQVALLDYTHMEDADAPDGGYPGKSIHAGDLLDVRMTNTEHLREWMGERGAALDSIEVRRCAIDTEQWRPDAQERAEARAALGVAGDTPVVAFVGRMTPQKRPQLFAETLAVVARRGKNFAAFAVGTGESQRLLHSTVKRLGLSSRIRLLGALPPEATRRVLRASDILLLPSANEGLAIVLIEAMALGVVPVVSRVGGQAELVTAASGYLIDPGAGDVAQYADAVSTLITNASLRRDMALEARHCVERAFTMPIFAQGAQESITRALSMAANRTQAPDAGADELARRLVAQITPADVLDSVSVAREQSRVARYVRQARQLAVATGSARYAAYKRLRTRLRELRASQTTKL